ncbi:unnamed protein product [Linum trigynum]|uniref:Uncharacterized protein n=1 Tax=Linum trigynum TaxID=586398 RepID=A0AAV2FF68_9ROSI
MKNQALQQRQQPQSSKSYVVAAAVARESTAAETPFLLLNPLPTFLQHKRGVRLSIAEQNAPKARTLL